MIKYSNEYDKLRSVFNINPKKLTPPSDTLPTSETGVTTSLYDFEVEIISKYKLNHEYLFNKIIEAKIIYNVEALNKFFNLYINYINNLIDTAEITKKVKILEEIDVLETALLVAENRDDKSDVPINYDFTELININTASDQTIFLNRSDIEKLLVYKKRLLEKSNSINSDNINTISFKNIRNKIESSFYINQIKNIEKKDISILELFRDLFYNSNISATSVYNSYLLSIFIFINIFVFLLVYFWFLLVLLLRIKNNNYFNLMSQYNLSYNIIFSSRHPSSKFNYRTFFIRFINIYLWSSFIIKFFNL